MFREVALVALSAVRTPSASRPPNLRISERNSTLQSCHFVSSPLKIEGLLSSQSKSSSGSCSRHSLRHCSRCLLRGCLRCSPRTDWRCSHLMNSSHGLSKTVVALPRFTQPVLITTRGFDLAISLGHTQLQSSRERHLLNKIETMRNGRECPHRVHCCYSSWPCPRTTNFDLLFHCALHATRLCGVAS